MFAGEGTATKIIEFWVVPGDIRLFKMPAYDPVAIAVMGFGIAIVVVLAFVCELA